MTVSIESVSVRNVQIRLFFHLDDELRQRWQTLFEQLSRPSFLHHPLWYQAYQGSYGVDELDAARFIEIIKDEQTIAVLPLIEKCKILQLMWPTDMGVRDITVDYTRISPRQLLDVLQQGLPRLGLSWKRLVLPDVVEHSNAHRLLNECQRTDTLIDTSHSSCRLPCSGSAEDCLSFTSSRFRKLAKKRQRELEKHGALSLEIIDSAERISDAYQAFLKLEDTGWKGSKGNRTSLLCDAAQNTLYARLFSADGVEQCGARIAVLHLNNEPIAIKLILQTGNTLNLMKITYADAYKIQSPGNTLLIYLLKNYCADPAIEYISFVTGPEWATRWNPESLSVYSGMIFNNSYSGILDSLKMKCVYSLKLLKRKYFPDFAKSLG